MFPGSWTSCYVGYQRLCPVQSQITTSVLVAFSVSPARTTNHTALHTCKTQRSGTSYSWPSACAVAFLIPCSSSVQLWHLGVALRLRGASSCMSTYHLLHWLICDVVASSRGPGPVLRKVSRYLAHLTHYSITFMIFAPNCSKAIA
jgi:hypothetical protein